MTTEQLIAHFVTQTQLKDIPASAQAVAHQILMTVVGTSIAGASEDGVSAMLQVYGERLPLAGPGARVWVHGLRTSCASAATINGYMARALDYCDAMDPGLHIGSSLIPAAMAAAEAAGGCNGQEFISALCVGAELASRMNLSEQAYAGLDPTGVAGVFGATAAAARVLTLTAEQTLHALALAFNRCGGSFQSNVDGSLAVRTIQGWVAGDGVLCAQLAKAGITGPRQFISGIYGYANLFAKDPRWQASLVDKLGHEYRMHHTMFKKYPSCGLTQGATELALRLQQACDLPHRAPIEHIEVCVPHYAYKLVGHAFSQGDNPRVNAQFSLQYCVANALVRQSSTLEHFQPQHINHAEVLALAQKVHVIHDPRLDEQSHTSVSLLIRLSDGASCSDGLAIAPGFPGEDLSPAEHSARLHACLSYAGLGAPAQHALLDCLTHIAHCPDVRQLVDYTLQ